MRRYITKLLLLFFLTSCEQRTTNLGTLDYTIAVNPILDKLSTDTLQIDWQPHRKKYAFDYFDDCDGICKLSNDTLFISSNQGSMPSNVLEIRIHNREFWIDLREYNCTYRHKYKILQQKLTINNPDFKVGDFLVGELFCQGINMLDTPKKLIDTTTISGKFKLKIRSKDFDFDSLIAENNYKKLLLAISTNLQPDTVTQLNLWKCGLISLPAELSKFINLKKLYLDENNFCNADLRMLCQFKKLSVISFQNCNISQFPVSILCLKNLEVLDLFNNNLTYLPIELFQLTKLKELQLGGNLLTSLPKEILNLKKLEMLEISGSVQRNRIKKLPVNFFESLSDLKEFYAPDSMRIDEYKDFKPKKNL